MGLNRFCSGILAVLAVCACSTPPKPRVNSEWIAYPRPAVEVHGAVLRALKSIGYAVERDESGDAGFVVEARFDKPDWRIRQRVEGRAAGADCEIRCSTRTTEEPDIVHGGWYIYHWMPDYETPEYDDTPRVRAANAHEILRGTIERELERVPEPADVPN